MALQSFTYTRHGHLTINLFKQIMIFFYNKQVAFILDDKRFSNIGFFITLTFYLIGINEGRIVAVEWESSLTYSTIASLFVVLFLVFLN